MARIINWTVVSSSLALAATSCGGGGGSSSSGAITGLSAPSQMQVVTAQGVPTPGASGSVAPGYTAPPGSDYDTDAASGHVYDPSMEVVGQVNNILCMVSHTAYDQMVNQGLYVAQIDESKCDEGKNNDSNSSSQGQSSGSNAVQPDLFVVDSSRADEVSPEIVKFWVPGINVSNNVEGTVRARLVVTNGVDASDPFGQFTLNFAGLAVSDTLQTATMIGNISTLPQNTGLIGFDFYNKSGDVNQVPTVGSGAELVQAAVSMNSDQSGGLAHILKQSRYNDPQNGDSGIQTTEYQLAYDANYVLRGKDSDAPVCLHRDQFSQNVWRYNLYYASGPNDGQRVELDSGFPFKTATNDHGYMSYWGMWTPNGVTVANGDTVYKDVWGSATQTPYTVLKAPGKLIRHTKNTLALINADGMTFNYWDFVNQSPPVEYRVQYQTGEFVEIASWDQNSQSWQTLQNPITIDTSAVGFLNMWSDSLGGQVTYIDGDNFITFYAQSFVTVDPGSSLTLYGFVNCLDSSITALAAESGDVFLANAPDVSTPYTFIFDGNDLTLRRDVDADGIGDTVVGLAAGEVPSQGPFTWGMSTGALVTDTSSMTNIWDGWAQSVFYTYETGANQWNQYTALVDGSGAIVQFDAPIQFSYTHSTVNDRNGDSTYDQQTYLLNYGGPGSLWGIPSSGVDMDGDGNPDRWLPNFSIADGVVMGPNGTEYAIRGIDAEYDLLEDPAGCVGLDLTGASVLVLPDGSTYTAPQIGPMPSLDVPPAVIDGVVQ